MAFTVDPRDRQYEYPIVQSGSGHGVTDKAEKKRPAGFAPPKQPIYVPSVNRKRDA
ncbi:MAG TPA: hypothetical protein VNN79_02825 [Actinomycetota bacterium]|nr:hypothetical protein [Actinomycetota bacterium]